MRTMRYTSLLIVLVALTALAKSVPAAAQQHPNANAYVMWDFDGASGFWNTDQRLLIERRAHASYWAHLWSWTGTSSGGYVGLQTDGGRMDGSTGDTAIFSLWDATAARGEGCGSFSGGGSGLSCRIAYPIELGRWYRLRIWRLEADEHGQWWGAWILDEATGQESHVGSISVSHDRTLMAPPRNFSEYYGKQVACDAVPFSRVYWTEPAANSRGDGSYEFHSSYAHESIGSCTPATVTSWGFGTTVAVRLDLGAESPGWLKPGETLSSGQGLASQDGRYVLRMQDDGNLVQYGPEGPLFSSATAGKRARLEMQHDGNAVVYGADQRPLWNTGTHGHEGAALVVQNDGNVVVYASDKRTPLWAAR